MDMIFTYCGQKPAADVRQDVTKVVVQSSVTEIGDGAFEGCTSLVSIEIPSSVTVMKIGKFAFEECTSLVWIEIPSSVTEIGILVFKGCTSLVSIEIPSSVTEIGDGAFVGCTSLKSIKISKKIVSHAFVGCTLLVSIEIPSSVTEISPGAFKGCTSLVSIEIPSSVTEIGDGAFVGCTSLKSIKILKKIGSHAFVGCTSLVSIKIRSSVTEISAGAFEGCTSLGALVSIEIPSFVTEIGSHAFWGCTSLVSIEIPPSSVTEIGSRAFWGCTSLVSIDIPSSVTEIRVGAIKGCTSLVSIEIPSSVSEIGDGAFEGCTSLVSIEIPSSVKEIRVGAFEGCTSLVSIEIPSSVTEIGDFVFLGCVLLQEASKRKGVSVEEMLKKRFNDFPLHRICHRANVTREKIIECLDQNQNAAEKKDYLGLTALSILSSNLHGNANMIMLLVEQYDVAVKEKDRQNALPLHRACANVRADLEMIQILVEASPDALQSIDDNNEVPLVRAFEFELAEDILRYLFSCHPINASQLHNTDATKLYPVAKTFLSDIKKMSSPISLKTFPKLRQNGWVNFVSVEANMVVGDKTTNLGDTCIEFIKTCDKEVAEVLAYSKDLNGRLAINYAIPKIKAALQERLLFLGRYDFTKGHPLHKSATCIVLKAYDEKAEEDYSSELDEGQRHEVAIKFMKHKDQFLREVDFREKMKISTKFVVDVKRYYNGDENVDFCKAVQTIPHLGSIPVDRSAYKYAIVMPCADRNLDTIFRSERPDIFQIRAYAKQIAEALQHLHNQKIIHGDIKLLNIVRFQGRLRLIDLDASARISESDAKSYVGSKFSSGVLPPEMIARLDQKQWEKFHKYFHETTSHSEVWMKIAPKVTTSQSAAYSVKTFITREKMITQFGHEKKVEEPVSADSLPYELVEATQAIDIWAFGTIIFTLCTGLSLFEVSRDDDLSNGDAMEELCTWTDERKLKAKLDLVVNPSSRKLLSRLLSRDNRYVDIYEVLQDDFFKLENPLTNDDVQKEILRNLDDIKWSTAMIEKNTFDLIANSTAILQEIKRSTSVLCKTIFEATEVSTPTCFIILPYEIDAPAPPKSNNGVKNSELAQGNKWEEAEGFINIVVDLITRFSNPLEFAEHFIEKYASKTMYLYLVDEHTSKAVYDPSKTYPIKIKRKTEVVEKILPIMMLGIQTMAIVNKAAGLIHMFYPAVPVKFIPPNLLESAKAFAKDSNLDVIKDAWDGEGDKAPKRGGQLREFEIFLELKDPKKTFSNLKRLCDNTGNAIWVTEQSHVGIEVRGSVKREQRKAQDKIENLKREKRKATNQVAEKQNEIERLRKQVAVAEAKAKAGMGADERETNDDERRDGEAQAGIKSNCSCTIY
eukprot:scaffold5943_cov56-Attheya_sp.AAC.1